MTALEATVGLTRGSVTMDHLYAHLGDGPGWVFGALATDQRLTATGKVEAGRWREKAWRWPAEAGELVAWFHEADQAEDADCYFTPSLSENPLRADAKRRQMPAEGLHADLDGIAHPERLELLVAAGAWTVRSGSDDSVHLYVPLVEALDPDTAADLLVRLADWLEADPAPARLNAYLRPAGTRNHKRRVRGEGPPVVVELDHRPQAGKAWHADELDDLLPAVRAKPAEAVAAPDAERLPDFLPDPVRAMLTERVTPGMDRSERTMAAAGTCVRHGLTDGQTITALAKHAPTVEKYGPTDAPRFALEVTRAARKARAKQDELDGSWVDGTASGVHHGGREGDSPMGESGQAEDGPSSWARIDVVAAIRDGGPPPPDVWTHARGHRLLYAGRTHAFFGPSESLKSWAAQAATAEELMAGRDVFYIDYEDDEAGVGARLRALGAPLADIAEHLHYVRPNEPLVDGQGRWTRAGLVDFLPALHAKPWRLAVIDGWTEAMTTEALDISDNADSARFSRRLLRPLADIGAAVVGIDHQPKNASETARYAIGAQHKLSGLTGAAYRFETMRPLGRPDGDDPSVGTTKVTVSKDRPGFIRSRARDGVMGIFRVTSWPDDLVDAEMVDPADLGDAGADMELVARVLEHLGTYEGASKNQLEESVTGKRDGIRAAIGWLIGKGWVRVAKEGQAHRHYLTDEGRREGLQA